MDKTVVPDVSSPRSKEAQQKLLELTKHGLLNVGDKVQFHYKTKEFIATVTAEGCLLYQGENGESELFLSPSAFVNTLAKRQSSSSRGRSKPKLNLNGWEFCMVAGVSLSQLKQQLESIQQAEGSSSKWRVQKEQEGTTGKSEMKEQADAEETLSPLKKKQRVEETNQQQYDQGEMMQSGAELAQGEQVADVLKPTVEEEKQQQQEEEEEEEEEELLSQPTESENDENKNIKKRTTRLSSGSIKHVSYTKGTKQTSNDEGSSVDPEKSDDDKELEDMQTEESNTASRGGRRRKLSRNSNRSKLAKGKLEASSDEEGKSVSRRHLRRDKTKVSSNQEADPSSNSEDNGEVKQENDELNSQATGEEDAEDMEEPWTYLLEQIAEAERIELHCGWSKEDRESLLVALKETKQLDATVLSQHVKSKSPEEITEYLKVLKDRLGKDDEGMQPDVSFYAALLSLELYHSGAISPGGLFSKKLEHMDKNTVFHDSVSQGKSPFKRGISDSDRKLKKMRKELEELRNKVEMEMASRRDLELEKQLLDVQLQEAKRATEREARKRAAIEDENEELKVRELETRRRLDRLKLKLNAIKGEPNTSTAITPGEGKDVSLSSPRSSNPETSNANSCHVETTKDESSHVVQEESTETKSHREQILEEEIERLKSKVASLETEVSDFQQDSENERRKNHHLMEAKKYLEISLNEVLHASKSTSGEEMESTSHETADVPAKNLDNSNNHHMYSKDVYEKRVNPSAFRISSSVIARRRKSVAFRSMVL